MSARRTRGRIGYPELEEVTMVIRSGASIRSAKVSPRKNLLAGEDSDPGIEERDRLESLDMCTGFIRET